MNRNYSRGMARGMLPIAGFCILTLTIWGQNLVAQSGAQGDAEDLRKAREYFQSSKLDEAEKICSSLMDKDKGGTVADLAGKLLDQIKSRRICQDDAKKALVPGIDCPEVEKFLGGIRERCPDYPGLDTIRRAAGASCVNRPGPPVPPPDLDKGIKLYKKGDYRRALDFFEALQTSGQKFPEVQEWIQKTEVELLVRDIEASLRHGDVSRAKDQLSKLEELAPQDDRIHRLQAKLPSSAGITQTSQVSKGSSANDDLLLSALREFYAGHLPHADQMLEQYVATEGNHKALAYFYIGAILSTEDFLTGTKDLEKEKQAREFFSKARQADRRFSPSGDWVSPRIIQIYNSTSAGT